MMPDGTGGIDTDRLCVTHLEAHGQVCMYATHSGSKNEAGKKSFAGCR